VTFIRQPGDKRENKPSAIDPYTTIGAEATHGDGGSRAGTKKMSGSRVLHPAQDLSHSHGTHRLEPDWNRRADKFNLFVTSSRRLFR